MSRQMVARALRGALLCAMVFTALACGHKAADEAGKEEETVAFLEQALTSNERIVGFEGPIGSAGSDWTTSQGTIAPSSNASAGSQSLVLSGGPSARITSRALTSLGSVGSEVTLDVWLPTSLAGLGWKGQISLTLNSEQAGVYSSYLGPFQFTNLPVGSFQTVRFALPDEVASKLSSQSYSDLVVVIQFELPNNDAPAYLDNLRFSPDSGSDAGGGASAGAGSGPTGGEAAGAPDSGGAPGGPSSGGVPGGPSSGGSTVGGGGSHSGGVPTGGGGSGAGGVPSGGGVSGAGGVAVAGGTGGTGPVGAGGTGGVRPSGGTGTGSGGLSTGGAAPGGGVGPIGGAGPSSGGLSSGGYTAAAGGLMTGATGPGNGGSLAGGAPGAGATSGGAGAGAGTGGSGVAGPGTGIDFFFLLPHRVSRSEIVLGTTGGDLYLNDGVRLVSESGGFSSVSSLYGGAVARVGVEAELANAWSDGSVRVANRAKIHGSVWSSGAIEAEPDSVVEGQRHEYRDLGSPQTISWTVYFPDSNQGAVSLEPGEEQTLLPGAYGAGAVKQNAHLRLRTGT